MPKAARTRAQQRRFEWTLLAMALLALVAWLSPPGQLAGPNHLIQDLGLRALAALVLAQQLRHHIIALRSRSGIGKGNIGAQLRNLSVPAGLQLLGG